MTMLRSRLLRPQTLGAQNSIALDSRSSRIVIGRVLIGPEEAVSQLSEYDGRAQVLAGSDSAHDHAGTEPHRAGRSCQHRGHRRPPRYPRRRGSLSLTPTGTSEGAAELPPALESCNRFRPHHAPAGRRRFSVSSSAASAHFLLHVDSYGSNTSGGEAVRASSTGLKRVASKAPRQSTYFG